MIPEQQKPITALFSETQGDTDSIGFSGNPGGMSL